MHTPSFGRVTRLTPRVDVGLGHHERQRQRFGPLPVRRLIEMEVEILRADHNVSNPRGANHSRSFWARTASWSSTILLSATLPAASPSLETERISASTALLTALYWPRTSLPSAVVAARREIGQRCLLPLHQ